MVLIICLTEYGYKMPENEYFVTKVLIARFVIFEEMPRPYEGYDSPKNLFKLTTTKIGSIHMYSRPC